MSLLIAAQIRDCSDQKHAITNREFVIHDYKSTRDCSPHIKNPAFVIRYIHVVKKVKSRPKNHPGNHPEWLPLKSHLSKDPRSCSRSRAPPQGWLLLGSHLRRSLDRGSLLGWLFRGSHPGCLPWWLRGRLLPFFHDVNRKGARLTIVIDVHASREVRHVPLYPPESSSPASSASPHESLT